MPDYNFYELSNVLKKINERLEKVECCCSSLNGTNLGLGETIFYRKNRHNVLEFKSLLAGNNISLTSTNNSITINSTGSTVDCQDIKDCIGIDPLGAPNKYLNEQGNFVTVSGFSCADLSTCSTTNLPEGSNLYFTNSRAITALTGQNISLFTNDSGYIKLTDLSSGTGISYNNLTGVITNSAPDQTVVLTSGVGINITGTYPSFTIKNTDPDKIVSIGTTGTGLSVTGSYPSFTLQNTLPDQTVALSSGTGISITGTYPNFTITNTSPSSGGTVTSVGATSPITSSGGTTPTISTSMATNRLIGRSTAGTGVMEEITVGTGLSLSGGTLSATASSSVGFEMNFLLMGA